MKQTLSSNRVSFYLFSTKTFSDEKYVGGKIKFPFGKIKLP